MHYSPGASLACGQTNNTNSTNEVKRVTCQKCAGSTIYRQGYWFAAFQDHTGTEPMGLEEWAVGTMPFDKAAQYSLACFRQETQEMIDRLEHQLNPLVL